MSAFLTCMSLRCLAVVDTHVKNADMDARAERQVPGLYNHPLEGADFVVFSEKRRL